MLRNWRSWTVQETGSSSLGSWVVSSVFLKCQGASCASVTSLMWEQSEMLAPDVLSPENWSFYKRIFHC